MLNTLNYFLFLIFLEITSRRICSITLPGIRVRLVSLEFPGSSLSFLKAELTFVLLQSSGSSSDHHDHSKTTDCPSSDISPQHFSVHIIKSHGLLCVQSKYSLTWSFSTEASFPSFRHWHQWRGIPEGSSYQQKMEVKKKKRGGLSNSGFLCPLSPCSLPYSVADPHFSCCSSHCWFA